MKAQRKEQPKDQCVPASSNVPQLIIKLRWAGLEGEAERLESMVITLPSEERCSVSFGPFSTD